MTEWLESSGVFIAGILSGILFFGGLWYTVRKGVRLRNPFFLFSGSFIIRTAVVMAVFYYISDGSWQRILICTAGFVAARFAVISFTGKPGPAESPSKIPFR
ncbi:MAG: hypothetical protein ABS46_04485 [Cytophagaceae bacterium SCN 52-12]|nr:MAG: hypothetical protein ABS46_04485 [Cytophagaceae bacterium SCN 52-12]